MQLVYLPCHALRHDQVVLLLREHEPVGKAQASPQHGARVARLVVAEEAAAGDGEDAQQGLVLKDRNKWKLSF